MISAVLACGALGYALGRSYDPDPLIFGDDTCALVETQNAGEVWLCQQGEKEFLVVPLSTYVP